MGLPGGQGPGGTSVPSVLQLHCVPVEPPGQVPGQLPSPLLEVKNTLVQCPVYPESVLPVHIHVPADGSSDQHQCGITILNRAPGLASGKETLEFQPLCRERSWPGNSPQTSTPSTDIRASSMPSLKVDREGLEDLCATTFVPFHDPQL